MDNGQIEVQYYPASDDDEASTDYEPSEVSDMSMSMEGFSDEEPACDVDYPLKSWTRVDTKAVSL